MNAEDEQQRRGEPVLVYGRPGTIEWGGVTRPASVYFEQGGRDATIALDELVPDPGAPRPVWDGIQRRLGAPRDQAIKLGA